MTNDTTTSQPTAGTVSESAVSLPPGTRIRFLKTLTEPATGDHPLLVYAKAGELGTIVEGRPCSEGHWAIWDGWQKASFGAVHGTEFEVVE